MFLVLDCDSTLSAIEGVDEMARLLGPEIFHRSEEMTNAAMNGGAAIEDIFARRLEMIRPTEAMCETVAAMYDEHRAPGAAEAIESARKAGWTPMIISGGFRRAILPFAAKLGITRVLAVDLFFDRSGGYAGYDIDSPTSRKGGKPDIVRALRSEFPDAPIVVVGDGATDLECRGVATRFVGFGGFVIREKVKAGADGFITHFSELAAELEKAKQALQDTAR